MGYRRRYRRKRSRSGGVLSDTTHIANRLSWKGAVLFGLVLFVMFYWLLPAWMNHLLESRRSSMFFPAVEAIFTRRIHWLQWLGIAFALICGFFAVSNYLSAGRLSPKGERHVSFFSRLLARFLD